MRRLLTCMVLLSLLAGCGGTEDPAVPDVPTTAIDEAVQPTQVVIKRNPDLELPGRILFTKNGQVWMRHNSEDRLLIPSGKAVHPSLNPSDGSLMAYVQREESYADLYIRALDEDGRGLQVTENEEPGVDARSELHVRATRWAFHPAWSPDGSKLAFVSQKYPPSCDGRGTQGDCEYTREWPLSLYIYPVSAAESGLFADSQDLVLVKRDTDLTHPAWSPDGRYVAFTEAYRESDNLTIGLFDLQNPDGEVVIEGMPEQGAYDPVWSPDGSWLVFARRDGAGTDLWAITTPLAGVATPELVRLTEQGNVRAPAWSPDGNHIAYLSSGGGSVDMSVAAVTFDDSGRPTLGEHRTLLKQEQIDVDSGLSWGP